METKTYTHIDRAAAGWPSGPWDSEPDKMQWQDEATGLPCLAVRQHSNGHWCGYVGVPADHPLFGQDYEAPDVRVHGGLTYADRCTEEADEAGGICHVPGADESDEVWWFGFDCAHCDDLSPRDEMYAIEHGHRYPRGRSRYESYRSLPYVRAECRSLAEQLADTTPQ